jgi:hypothetical protein
MKSNIIQIKHIYNQQGTKHSILPNFRSGCILSIATSINDILATNIKIPIEEGNLLVNNVKRPMEGR